MINGKIWDILCLAVIALAITITSTVANAQMQGVPPPISYPMWLQLRNNPDALSQMQLPPPPPPEPSSGPLAATASPWQPLTYEIPILYSNPLLLTDGSVIVHNGSAQDWWKLTPDINGSYVSGTWSQIGSLPSGYAPLYFGSAVLPDGRVVVSGGEYNFNSLAWTNRGAIYSPDLNLWRSLSPPAGWANIGDAATVVLADGTYMVADALTKQQALLSTSTSGGISTSIWVVVGNGKFDLNHEEGWTLLPGGDVLTIDTYVGQPSCGRNSELYRPASGKWVSAGNIPNQLADCTRSHDIGPQVLRPEGTVVAFGGTTTGVAHTAIFDSSTFAWTTGPDLPTIAGQNYTIADGPAALLPSGNVLFAASPGLFNAPTHFFELDRQNNINQVADMPTASSVASYFVNFLVLPTGQILATDFFSIQIYSPSGTPDPSWAPVIDTYPNIVVRGTTYHLTGQQFNGRSQGAFYGDDVQAATNYPIVRLVNDATGHVFYAKTSGFNTMSIAPNTPSSTNFVAPGNTETGLSYLSVIANGIASESVAVVVQ